MAEKLNANDTLSKVLAYVDSPFKLFAMIMMAVLAFGTSRRVCGLGAGSVFRLSRVGL